jgi:uncharacterized protein YdhG (YjbR/CyaY superfamily)
MQQDKTAIPKSVDDYLRGLPADQRKVLKELRGIIKATAPEAEEGISYHIPGYKYHGPLVYFAAYKKHCSLFAVSMNIIKQFEKELAPFRTTTSTLHFTPENPLPPALVKKIVKQRMKENEAKKL